MRKALRLFPLVIIPTASAQGTFCDPIGKVAIFSNYDGGALTINVDQDIPGLRIGIVSYEFAVINVTGPFVSNVVEVQWAGFNGNNDHCGTGATTQSTVIGGVTSGASGIVVIPPASLANANGNPDIICAYSCDIANAQGGCNTADQVVDYFMDQWAGPLYFHRTQYGCWNSTWSISDGGNCCAEWVSTGVSGDMAANGPDAFPVPASDMVRMTTADVFDMLDMTGRHADRSPVKGPVIDVSGWPEGAYLLRDRSSGAITRVLVAR